MRARVRVVRVRVRVRVRLRMGVQTRVGVRVRVRDRVSHTVGELLLLPPQHVGRQEGRLGCVERLPQQPPC